MKLTPYERHGVLNHRIFDFCSTACVGYQRKKNSKVRFGGHLWSESTPGKHFRAMTWLWVHMSPPFRWFMAKNIFSYREQNFRDLFNDKNNLTSMNISACISNCIGVSQWDVITHSCHNGIGGLAKRLWSQACVSNCMTQTLLCQQNHVNKRDPRQSRHPEDHWRGALMIYLFTHFLPGDLTMI